MTNTRRFEVPLHHHTVPAILWTPERGIPPHPLVLAGHGGRGHKTDPFVTAVREFLLPKGIAVAAIDAINHGDRIDGEPTDEQILADLANPTTYESMTEDWKSTLDVLLESGNFAPGSIGYIGLSGGTLFGLPFVAADPRVTVAALGAAGYQSAPMLATAAAVFAPTLRHAAQAFTRPLLFHLQQDDDFFPPAGGRSLFADIASEDKQLVTSPGTHQAVPAEALQRLCDWLVSRLSPQSAH